MELKKLSNNEINSALELLNKDNNKMWVLKNDSIEVTYKFKDFNAAFAFMTKCAPYIDEIDHHPEWFNVYNSLTIKLTTHDVKGLSFKDFDLANKMKEYYA